MRLSIVAMLMTLAFGLLGCDPGQKQLDLGRSLEQQGKLQDAEQAYTTVCSQAPTSKSCEKSKASIDDVRLQLATLRGNEGSYSIEKALLEKVIAAKGAAATKASSLLTGPELIAGLTWERAKGEAPAAALQSMEDLSAGGTPVAARAKQWLGLHEAEALVGLAKEACGSERIDRCRELRSRLAAKHPGTKEDAEAQELLAEAERRQVLDALRAQGRVYSLLMAAERRLAECATLTRQNKVRSDCMQRGMIADLGGDVGQVMTACGGPGTDEENAGPERLKTELESLLEALDKEPVAAELKARIDMACEQGQYAVALRSPPRVVDVGDYHMTFAPVGHGQALLVSLPGLSAELQVPAELSVVDDDAKGLRAADGAARVRFDGGPPADTEEAIFARASAPTQTRSVAYKKSAGNWIVVSGYEGDRIYYDKTLVSAGTYASFSFTFPAADKSTFDPFAATMGRSFRLVPARK